MADKAAEAKPQKKGGGMSKMIIFALLGIVLLGAGIGAGMMLGGKKQDSAKKESADKQKTEGEEGAEGGEGAEGEEGGGEEGATASEGESAEGGEAAAGGHGGAAKTEGGEGGAEGKEGAKKNLGNFFTLDPPFMVNLSEVGGRRFLKVSIVLEVSKNTTPDMIEAKKPPIRDAIILLLSEKSFVDINTIEGKEKLKFEIIKRCNAYLKKGSVQNVHFTEFLIQ